jgi:HEAT repeat protein
MRIPTALVLTALSAALTAGCGGGGSTSGPSRPKAVKRTTTRRGPAVVAPATSFEIKPQDATARAKTAKTVKDGIEAERKKVIEGLVALMVTPNSTQQDKIAAAARLGELADPMAVPFLMTRLTQEKDRNVRLTAIASLGHIADPSSAEVLIALLDDQDLGIAQAALDALSVLTEADPPYAFVEGTTIKIRKSVRRAWQKKLEAGYFDKLKK